MDLRQKFFFWRRQLWRKVSEIFAHLRKGEHVFTVIVAIFIGVLGAYGAIAFRYLLYFTHDMFFTTPDYSTGVLFALPWWRRVLMPIFGGLAVGLLVTRFSPEVRGSGIPEVMESVSRRGGAIRLRVVLTKAIAAATTIGSGGSAGREGPIVHIGSAIGSAIGQFLQVSAARLRTFVACGAASAIAATFNAPIAGALFSIEVVLSDLGVASLSPIVISSVVATVISRHYLGDFPAFRVPEYQLVSSQELFLYLGLALIAGVMGMMFTRLLYMVSDRVEASNISPWMRPALGGLVVGMIGIWFPQVFGVGYETINGALMGETVGLMLLAIVCLKMIATAFTLGSGGSGGVFAPSLFLGATLGSAWGQFVHHVFPTWTAQPGAYALVGMGAFVAATTHAPITAILIIFELTNDYRIIPPLMLTCVLALLISGKLHKESIYTGKLLRRGVRLSEGRDVNILRSIRVHEVMAHDVPSIPEHMCFGDFVPRLLAGQHQEILVVDGENRLLGSVGIDDIKAVIHDSENLASLVVAADVVNEDLPFVLPDDNMDVVMHLFGRINRDQIPVCDNHDSRRVVGMVTRSMVIDAYNTRIFHMDLPGGFHSLVETVRGGRMVEVLGGIHLTEVEVPVHLVGKTLKEANLRKNYHVEVVLIHTSEDNADPGLSDRPGRMPGPDVKLHTGDRLLVMGTPEAIERLHH